MANADTPRGLRPVRYLNGSSWNGQARVYYIPSTDSTAVFKGDLVKLAGAGDTLGKYATVAQAAAGDASCGVVIGFGNTPYVAVDVTDLTRKYRPASTAMYVWVVDDPNVVFRIQEDSVAGALAATSCGTNCNVVVGSGSTTTGMSGMEIDSSEVEAAGATAQLRLLNISDEHDNALGTNANWDVLIAEHQLKTTTTMLGA